MTTAAQARPRARSTLRWLMPVVVLATCVSVGAGLLTRQVYSRPASNPVPLVGPTSTAPMSATQQPGDAVVRLTSDAAEHPDRGAVHLLLQRYFDAVNAHRYDLWRTTISAAGLAKALPESSWRSDNQTTRDGSIVVNRIDPAPGGNLRVLLTFVSVQDPRKAPAELPEPCIRWRMVYSLVREGGSFKIDQASRQIEKC